MAGLAVKMEPGILRQALVKLHKLIYILICRGSLVRSGNALVAQALPADEGFFRLGLLYLYRAGRQYFLVSIPQGGKSMLLSFQGLQELLFCLQDLGGT